MRGPLATLCMVTPWLCAVSCKPQKPEWQPRSASHRVRTAGSGHGVLARVGGQEVTAKELLGFYETLPVFVRLKYKVKERRPELLEAFVQLKVLASEAVRSNLDTSPLVVDTLKSELVREYLFEQVDSRVEMGDITDEEVRRFYQDHLYVFRHPEQVRVYHVLLKDEWLARRVAFRAMKRCQSRELDCLEEFQKLVRRFSRDERTRDKGGEIGWFPKVPGDPMSASPELDAAASGLQHILVPEGPVLLSDGFHVFLATERRSAQNQTLEEARSTIVGMLLLEKRKAKRREFIDQIVEKARIEIDDEVFERFEAEWREKDRETHEPD